MTTSGRRAAFVALLACLAPFGCGSSSEQGGADAAGQLDSSAGTDVAASTSDAGGSDAGGSDAASGSESGTSREAGPLPVDPCVEAGTCPPGEWINVTPASMSATVLAPTTNAFGPGAVVGDPSRPSDLYIGAGDDGLWKSTDYGSTWTQINSTMQGSPIGAPIAVAGTTPATIWVNSGKGDGSVYKSSDGGATFSLTGGGQTRDLYSIEVDPYDSTHLVSGLHEADGIVESTDGGTTWHLVGGSGWPAGGISWYPFFVDTGDAAGTRATWFAIAQDGAAPVMTSDEGATWAIPNGLASPDDAGVNGLQHPHGCTRLDQRGSTLFVGGVYGPGQGVYRSTDLGKNWSRVDTGVAPEAIVWSTPKSVYAMWGWACSDCNLGTNYETAAQPGTTWSAATVPAALVIGPNTLAVTSDGSHNIFVGVMWAQGIWRYVEP
jgi:hypothetical protein